MKNKLLIIFLMTCATSTIFVGCTAGDKKVEVSNKSQSSNNKVANSSDQTVINNKSQKSIVDFKKIKLGMTKTEVEQILGTGEKVEESGVEGVKGDSYKWAISEKMFLVVTFQDDKVAALHESF